MILKTIGGSHYGSGIRGITAVSVKLKNTIRTSKGYECFRNAERQLLNKCAGTINNSIQLSVGYNKEHV